MDILINIASFIVALGILVFVHEYGHYWVAKKNGVKVLRFAVGFGKPIYSWYGKDGTEYVIGAIPLGGYVRMLDGRVDKVEEADKPYAFDQKHVLRRIAIVAAGPLANFLFAILLIFFMLLMGVPAQKPVIGEVTANSPASAAGLQKHDVILSIDNKAIKTWQEANYAFIGAIGSETIELEIERGNRVLNPRLDSQAWTITESDLYGGLGLMPYRPEATLTLNFIEAGSPADLAGLKVGDRLVAIDDKLLKSWSEAVSLLSELANQTVSITVQRDLEIVSTDVRLANRPTEDGFSRGYLGVIPKFEVWPKDYVFINHYAILPAIENAFLKTVDLIQLTFSMIGKFISGTIGMEHLSGPVAIAQGAGMSAQSGLIYFISFMALISVNLGVVNLLPLPVLDGGHLMYFIIELIRGKPVSERVQELGFRIGAVTLMLIMGIALFNDFGRL